MQPAMQDILLAFIVPCIAVSSADGDFSELRKSRLYECLQSFPLFSNLHMPEHRMIINQAVKQVYNDGIPLSLSKSAQVLNLQLRESAFAWACELAILDDEVSSDVSQMVQKLLECFEISNDAVTAIGRSLNARFLTSPITPLQTKPVEK